MLTLSQKQMQAFDEYLFREFARKTARVVVEKLPLERDPDSSDFINEVFAILSKANVEYGIQSKGGLQEFACYYFSFPGLRLPERFPAIRDLLLDRNLRESLKLEQLFFRLKSLSAA